MRGASGSIVNVIVGEINPLGLITERVAAPDDAIKVNGTAAVMSVGLTKVVARGKPFHCTMQLIAKLSPVTVRANDGSPAVADAGDSALEMLPSH